MPHPSLHFDAGSTWLWIVPAMFLLAAVFYYYRRTHPPSPRWMRKLLFGLRGIALLLLILALTEPVLTLTRLKSEKPVLAVLIDRSASMNLVDGRGSRRDVLADLLEGAPFEALRQQAQLSMFAFSDDCAPEDPMIPDSLMLDGHATNISRALIAVRDKLKGQHIEGILLFSDGAHTLGKDPVTTAEGLGFPIHAVGIGDPTQARDVQVIGVFPSEIGYVGKPVSVEAMIRSRGYAGLNVPIRLSEGEKRLDEQIVSLVGEDLEQRVALTITPSQAGRHTYELVLPVQQGELSGENNRRLFSVDVLESKVRILLVAGSPSADLVFLRRMWERNEDFQVRTVVLGKRGKMEAGAVLRKTDTDLVVLLDVPLGALEGEPGQKLVPAVREEGVGLLVLGGAHAFGVGTVRGNPISELLPWTMVGGRSSYQEGAFALRIAPEGAHHPILRLSEDPLEQSRRWEALPPLLAYNGVGKVQSWARVLAVHPTIRNAHGPVPLIAVGQRDRGKVMAAAFSTFWRWDLMMWGIGETSETSERFWTQVVNWLVRGEADAPVRIATEKPLYLAGEPVVFDGQVYDEASRALSGAEVQVAFEESGRERVVFLDEAGSGRYTGRAAGLPPGEYSFRGQAVIQERPIGEAQGTFTVGPYSLEFEHTAMNELLLTRIAHRSGGRFYTPDTFGAFLKDANLAERSVASVTKIRLWDWWVLFTTLIVLLCVEWTIRRRGGMI
ncbi:MAG: hypothetical protein V1800_17420 [Candidatus Latescibacterota bacterium]